MKHGKQYLQLRGVLLGYLKYETDYSLYTIRLTAKNFNQLIGLDESQAEEVCHDVFKTIHIGG